MGVAASAPQPPKDALPEGARSGNLSRVPRAIESSSPPPPEQIKHAAWTAVAGNHPQIVRYLLDKGASANSISHDACRALSIDIFEAMYDHGWNAEHINSCMAAWPNMYLIVTRRACLEWMSDHGMNVNLPGDRDPDRIRGAMTPLHAVAQRGRYNENLVKLMETLVARGAAVEPFVMENSMRSRRGVFAQYKIVVLQWLVDHGADVNLPMKSGSSPLHSAVRQKKLDLVSFLLKNGVDASIRDPHTSMTALDEAEVEESVDIIDAISQHLGLGNVEGLSREESQWRRRLRPRR